MRLFVYLFSLYPPSCVTFILSHFSVIQIIPPLLALCKQKSPFPPKPSESQLEEERKKKGSINKYYHV